MRPMRNPMSRPGRIVILQSMLLLVMTSAGVAQGPGTGAIAGQVLDPSGAVIPNARLVVTNEGTNWSRAVTTTSQGLFLAPLLPPGSYSVAVEAQGFRQKLVRSLPVIVSETTRLDVTLQLEVARSQVQVTGAPELVQTESSALGHVTDERTLVALPLANRNFSQVLALSPGVLVEVPNAGALGRNTQNISANGAKTTSNNFQFNGVDANNIAQNSFSGSGFAPETGIAVPAPDTIGQFKVQTAMYDAGFGRGAGANVDLVSKAGTNKFHGSLWEFFRNDALNANDFFLKRNHQPRPVLKQNQFGGAFGGPLQKDKTFFFGSYQATIQRNGNDPSVSLVSGFLPPLTDDRSAAALGSIFGGQTGVNGGVAVAPDGSNINPVALALLNFKLPDGSYVIPNPQTILSGGVGVSTYSIPARYREDQFSVNLDHALSQRNQLAGRFFYSRIATNAPFTPFNSTVPGFGNDVTERNVMFVLSDTHVFNSNLINSARFGFMRFNGSRAHANPINAADVGMQTGSALPGIPGIQILGLFTIGSTFQPSYRETTNTFVWQDTVSLTHGKHSLRFGGEVKRHQLVPVPSTVGGYLLFLSFPDFLLGQDGTQNGTGQSNIFLSVGGSGIFRKDERYTDYAGFIQDDIRVTPRLTVNAGLRYEFFGPPSDINGRLPNFDPAIATSQVPSSGSFSGFVMPSNFDGTVPAGVVKTKRSGMWRPDHKDLSPRLGFSLRLSNSPAVVLRGGYGIYYQRLSGQLAAQSIGQPPFSLVQSLAGSANTAATLQQPFNPLLPPDSAYPIYVPRTPSSALFLQAIEQDVASPYTQQYDLNLQYEFARDFLWEVGYVGSKSSRLFGCRQFNQAPIATPQTPVNGETTTTTANVAARAPFSGIAGGSFLCGTDFDASYNSLQTSVTRRWSRGLMFQASYTFSKNLDFTSASGGLSSIDFYFLGNDQTKPQQSRGLSLFDRTHRFVLNFVYEPPRLEAGPSLVRHALSRWQFSGIAVAQSGVPITVLDSTAGTVYGNLSFTNRAQCTGGNPASSGSVFDRLGGYFDPAAFTDPPVIGNGTGFGNCGVGTLRGPSQINLDFGVQRTFPVKEGSNLLFRAEFFNLTNTPKFGQPVSDRAAGPAFGLISSTASNPRIVQFALKFNF